jgi:hypothetical protein
MDITRQHDSTTIEELTGATCTGFLGIGPGKEAGFHAWYLKANDTWYRFFIQCGILFWDTSTPDPEDDLADGEDYFDVIEQNGRVVLNRIEAVEMADGYLKIVFTAGPILLFKEIEENAGMSITVM